jgi:hypothetical protein
MVLASSYFLEIIFSILLGTIGSLRVVVCKRGIALCALDAANSAFKLF